MRPLRCLPAIVLLALLFPLTSHAALEEGWRRVPADTPSESLLVVLRRFEAHATRGAGSASAAFALGQFHFSRGEYAQAEAAFIRSAGRVSGVDRGEARYWEGLTHLALANFESARTAFEDAARQSPRHRALARLGVAQALEAEGRRPQALAELQRLVATAPGEAGPAALAALAVLADRLGRSDEGERARERVLREYPQSVEAARLEAQPARSILAPVAGGVIVQIGAFSDEARARSLAQAARRAGFPGAAVESRAAAAGRPALHRVRLGSFTDASEARAMLDRAERALGVTGQVVPR